MIMEFAVIGCGSNEAGAFVSENRFLHPSWQALGYPKIVLDHMRVYRCFT